MRVASDVLQRRRARDQERVAREYREDRQGTEEEPVGPIWSYLTISAAVDSRLRRTMGPKLQLPSTVVSDLGKVLLRIPADVKFIVWKSAPRAAGVNHDPVLIDFQQFYLLYPGDRAKS